jgi:hypothetical protein
LAELFEGDLALLGADLGGLGLELFLFLIGEPEGLSPGLILALLLEAHELHLLDVLLAALLDLLSVVPAEQGEPAFGVLGVLGGVGVPPAAHKGGGLQELVGVLVVVAVGGFAGGREAAEEGFGKLGGCTVDAATRGHCGVVYTLQSRKMKKMSLAEYAGIAGRRRSFGSMD